MIYALWFWAMSVWQKKRFWSEVSIVADGENFIVSLDDKILKTPSKKSLILPTYALAKLIADEWCAQGEIIAPSILVHTRRANSAIDKIADARVAVISKIASYVQSDLLCYWENEEAELIARQEAEWTPAVRWAKEALDLEFNIQSGIMPIAQPAQTCRKAVALTSAQNNFSLAALSDLVSLTGSFILGMAAIKEVWSLTEIWQKSRIDEIFQAEKWGEDDEALAQAQQKYTDFCAAFIFYHASISKG